MLPCRHACAGALLALIASCAPQVVDRVVAPDGGGGGIVERPDGPAPIPEATPDGPAPIPEAGLPDGRRRRDAPVAREVGPDVPAGSTVVLVVGDPTMLEPGDVVIRDVMMAHLTEFQLRVRNDGDPADLTDTALVVIAGSTLSETIGGKYRNSPIPVITLEGSSFDQMGLTGNVEEVDMGFSGPGTQLTILNPAHPLAAGLSTPVEVLSEAASMSWGRPASSAIRIASIPEQPEQIAIFAYEQDAEGPDDFFPARRVGWFAHDAPAARLSEPGIKLLRAALDWALSRT